MGKPRPRLGSPHSPQPPCPPRGHGWGSPSARRGCGRGCRLASPGDPAGGCGVPREWGESLWVLVFAGWWYNTHPAPARGPEGCGTRGRGRLGLEGTSTPRECPHVWHTLGTRAERGGEGAWRAPQAARHRGGQGGLPAPSSHAGRVAHRTPRAHGDTGAATSLPLGSVATGAATVVPAPRVSPCAASTRDGWEGAGFHPPSLRPRSGAWGSFWLRSGKASTSLRPSSDTAAPRPGIAPTPAPWGRVGPSVQPLSGAAGWATAAAVPPPAVPLSGLAGGLLQFSKVPEYLQTRWLWGDLGEPPGLQPWGAASGTVPVPSREPAAGLTLRLGTPSSGTVHTTGGSHPRSGSVLEVPGMSHSARAPCSGNTPPQTPKPTVPGRAEGVGHPREAAPRLARVPSLLRAVGHLLAPLDKTAARSKHSPPLLNP